MSKRDQMRFYDVAEIYLDDERVMAWAIPFYCEAVIDSPETIYRNLLAGKYGRWIDHLEQIADEICHTVLKEWCEQKQFDLDMMNDYFWSPGDNSIIEKNGWKLNAFDIEEGE